MFVVARYFNYRKDASFEVLGYSLDLERAKSIAQEYVEDECYEQNAREKLHKKVSRDEPNNSYIYAEKALARYYIGDGYEEMVYVVVKAESFD